MPIVEMPNGDQVQFPDDMPREQIRDMIAKKFPNETFQANASRASQKLQGPVPTPDRGNFTDPLRQGVTFGFSDEIDALKGGIGRTLQGGNFGEGFDEGLSEARTNLQSFRERNPVGSTALEIGGAIPTSVVGGGAALAGKGATLLPRLAGGAALGGAQGAVYGAGSADGDLGERARGAGFGAATGAAAGAVVPAMATGVNKAFGRIGAAMPEISDLYRAKNAAYKLVDKSGFRYSAPDVDNLFNDMFRRVGKDQIDVNPNGAHKAAVRMLERISQRKGAMSLGELDQLRQVIRRDVVDTGSRGDGHFGGLMIDAIDDFIDRAGGASVVKSARSAHKTLRKSELLAEALDKAQLNAASSGSGGNIDNAIRQQIKAILTNKSKVRSFTESERTAMRALVGGGGSMQSVLRLIGKLSPSGNGLMAALGVGATAANPVMAVPVGAGIAAKKISDGATQRGAQALQRAVRTGGASISRPQLPPPGLLQRGASPMIPYLSGRVGEAVNR